MARRKKEETKKPAEPLVTRKKWSWPRGLADGTYYMIRKWFNQYDNTGKIHKSIRVPHERFGMEMPNTKVLLRVHQLSFTYSQIEWLHKTLNNEDEGTTQTQIFKILLEQFKTMQEEGTIGPGIAYEFEIALTKDEVGYIKKLLECIGIYRRPTPSEALLNDEAKRQGIENTSW